MSTSLVNLTTLGLLTFDAATVTFDYGSNITDHPVETGATVSDHIQVLPNAITITGTITESPYADQTNGVPMLRRQNALNWIEAARKSLIMVDTEQYGAFSSYAIATFRHDLTNVKRAVLVIVLKQFVQALAGFVTIPVSAPASPAVSASFATSMDAGVQASMDAARANLAASLADTNALSSIAYGWVN
jgi:hypothetical protein